MAAIPVWLRGRDVTTATFTGQTVAADGALADATGAGIQNLLTAWEEIDVESNPSLEEISAADSSRQHNVIVQENNRIRFSGLVRKDKGAGQGVNDKAHQMAYLFGTYDYLKVVITRGTIAAEDTWTFTGCRGAFRESIRKGRSTWDAVLEMADPGAANFGPPA